MLASQIPNKVPLPFANSGTKTAIPTASQIGITAGAASLTDGFPPLTFTPLASGGVPPAGADFNGIFNLITAVQQWQSAGGAFKYDAAFSTAIGGYPKGSVLMSTSNDTNWLNLLDGNTTDPDSGAAANWASLDSYGIAAVVGLASGTVTLTPAQYGKTLITLAGTLTGNTTLVFPNNQPLCTVANNTTGAFSLTCKTAAGTGGIIVQGGQEIFYGDGTNLVPRLGNTPAQFDNSAKVATTAFVQAAGLHFPVGSGSGLAVNQTLSTSQAGLWFEIQGAGLTITLPALAAAPAGLVAYTFKALNAFTLKGNGAELIGAGAVAGANTYAILAGQTVTVVSAGAGSAWYAVIDGFGAKSFASSLATNGYETMPNGRIMQWGQNNSSASADVSITFPIAFPTAVYSLVCTATSGVSASYLAKYNGLLTSGFNLEAYLSSTAARVLTTCAWVAIGK
jgi:hypothetical protein